MHKRSIRFLIYFFSLFMCSAWLNLVYAFGLDTYIKQQDEKQIQLLIYSLMGGGALLLILFCITLLLLHLQKRKRLSEKRQQTQMLDNLTTGIVHVSLGGKIISVNAAAARYMGRAADKLVGADFAKCFLLDNTDEFEANLQDPSTSVQAKAIASNLYVSLQASRIQKQGDINYRLITISNNNALHRDLYKAQAESEFVSHLFSACNYATVRLNTEEDSYTHDELFDQMFQIGAIDANNKEANNKEANSTNASGKSESLVEFAKRIHSHDANNWVKALNKASKQGLAQIHVRMRTEEQNNTANTKYLPVNVTIVADKHSGSEPKSEESEGAYKQFTLLVQGAIEHETQRSKLEIVSEQRDAMLAIIPHPAYAIDLKGNILWSNAAFDQLLGRISSNMRSKNIFELSPFPDEVMHLHKNILVSAQKNDIAEFEVRTERGVTLQLKMTLGSYSVSDRLNNESQKGSVVVLQDLSDIKNMREKLAAERERNIQINSELIGEQEHLVKLGAQYQQEKERLAETLVLLDKERISAKQSQESLEQVQQRMSRFLELAPVAIATINADDQITSANRVMLERLKYTEKELKKGNIYKLFSDPAEAGTTAKQLNNKGYLRDFHVKLKGKDGNIYAGELTVDTINSSILINDEQDNDAAVSQNKEYLFWLIDRSDEEFQRSKFESLLQHSDMPMAILEDSGFSKLNKAACQFFSVEDEEDLFGFKPYSEDLNQNEEQAQLLAQTIAEVKTQGTARTIEWQHLSAGEEKSCLATYVPIFKDHVFDCVLCMWSDKSAVHQSHTEIAELMTKLRLVEQDKQDAQVRLESSNTELNDTKHLLLETEQSLVDTRAELQATEAKLDALQSDYNAASEKRQALEQELEDKAESLSEVQERASKLDADYQVIQQSIKALIIERDELSGKLAELQVDWEASQQAINSKENETQALAAKSNEHAHEVSALKEELALNKSLLNEKEQDLATCTEQLSALTSEHEQLNQTAKQLHSQIEQERLLVASLEQQKRKLEDSEKQLQQNYEEEIAALENMHTEYAAIADKLMEQKHTIESLGQSIMAYESSYDMSKNKLEDKSIQLEPVDKTFEANQSILSEQEKAIRAVQELLKEAESQSQIDYSKVYSDIADLPLPSPANIWFDAVPFIQSRSSIESMQAELSELIDDISRNIDKMESALDNNEVSEINQGARTLIAIAKKTQSDALLQLMESIENDCSNDMIENVSIRWPAAKSGLQNTLRVVYSHLTGT